MLDDLNEKTTLSEKIINYSREDFFKDNVKSRKSSSTSSESDLEDSIDEDSIPFLDFERHQQRRKEPQRSFLAKMFHLNRRCYSVITSFSLAWLLILFVFNSGYLFADYNYYSKDVGPLFDNDLNDTRYNPLVPRDMSSRMRSNNNRSFFNSLMTLDFDDDYGDAVDNNDDEHHGHSDATTMIDIFDGSLAYLNYAIGELYLIFFF